MRASPQPPSFSKIAANTIDPAIGASTWAFGSHICTENIGSLTKNPKIVSDQNIGLFEMCWGSVNSVAINIDNEQEELNTIQKIANMGSEAVIVYIIKYILA